ncbi:type II toxin-antitoxin system PemK/MazF family toxin [Geodermatophilus sp. SYSU D01119]
MRLIFWLIGAAVLSTPVYGILKSLAAFEAVRWVLGVSESPRFADPVDAVTMLPLLFVGAAVWHLIMSRKAGGRLDLAGILGAAVTSGLLLVLSGALVTRLLTLLTPADEGALTLGPLLGCGAPLLFKILTRFARPRHTDPAVGEIWWADVPFEEVADSKDRPCLVIDANSERAVVLMITSVDKSGRPGYVWMDSTGWYEGEKSSWLKIDRRIPLKRADFRRYAGPCPPEIWAQVERAVLGGPAQPRSGAATALPPVPASAAPRGPIGSVALAPPAPKAVIGVPYVADDVRAEPPWQLPPILSETAVANDLQSGDLLAKLVLESARIRSLFTGMTDYDLDMLTELHDCAGRADLQGLWTLAVSETCLAFASVVPAVRRAALQEPSEEYEQLVAIGTNLVGRLAWCSSLPFAVPQAVGRSTLTAPYWHAEHIAPDDVDGWALASVGAFRVLVDAS